MTNDISNNDLDIAVIGMSGRFPGAPTIPIFWRNLCEGIESISWFSREELQAFGVNPEELDRPEFVPAAPVLDNYDCFDASFFGYSPREAELMDPQHRVFLECSWHALESAGYPPNLCPTLTGVYAGTSLSTYLLYNVLPSLAGPHADETFQAMIANDKDFLSTRVSYKLNLCGPSIDIQTGCSTSLVAIHLASQALLSYQCDLALAGGVSIQVPQRRGYVYQKGGLYSPDGHCRSFDAAAEGTLFGSGVGIVVLKRLADAIADRDTVHAIIRATAINNDGNAKVGYTAPSIKGQSEVIRLAHSYAGITSNSVGYVECHGTGTSLGDPAEVAALIRAFQAPTQDRGYCGIGSVKTNIGHLDAAAGIASFIKTTLAVEHGLLPPSLHFSSAHPDLGLEGSPFYVNDKLSGWRLPSAPRRAGVSSFGIGGTNAHVILEQSSNSAPSPSMRTTTLLTLSAKSNKAFVQLQTDIAEMLERDTAPDFADISYTAVMSRTHLPLRFAVVCGNASDAAKAIRNKEKAKIFSGRAPQHSCRTVFMFPGGGSQHINMAGDLYREDPLFRDKLNELLTRASVPLGFDLEPYLYPSDGDKQAVTGMQSPLVGLSCLFLIEYALAEYWISWGVVPDACIGHSLGEYLAACVAGILTFDEALSLVMTRSRLLMSLPAGSMLSIPLPVDELSFLIGNDLSIAGVNGPSQTVVSGGNQAIKSLAARLLEDDIESRQIQIAVSSHSHMVEPILAEFRRFVSTLKPQAPKIPYVSNVTGTWISADEATDPEYWVRHLRQTVLFSKGIGEFISDPKTILLEVGPGNALTTLLQTQFRSTCVARPIATMRHPYDRISDCEAALSAVAQVWIAGGSPRWARLYEGEKRRRVPLPTYPFERKRHWLTPADALMREGVSGNQPYKRWFHRPIWSGGGAFLGTSKTGAQSRRFVICAKQTSLSTAVAEQLSSRGFEVLHLHFADSFRRLGDREYSVGQQNPEDYRRFVEIMTSGEPRPFSIAFFGSLSPPRSLSADSQDSLLQDLKEFLPLLQGIADASDGRLIRVGLIISGAVQVYEHEYLRPENSFLLGLNRVAEQEFPSLRTNVIDVNDVVGAGWDEIAKGVSAQLMNTDPAPVVALRGRQHWTPSYERLDIIGDEVATGLRQEGTYLITGGLGNLGTALARYLVRNFRAKVSLVSHSGLPERTSWERLLSSELNDSSRGLKIRAVQKIEALGGEVLPLRADICDPYQLERAFAETEERFGQIHGVFHLAGTTGPNAIQLIADATEDSIFAQVRSKTLGALSLETVCSTRKPDFVFLFSSSAAYLGGTGLMAYSGANNFLDAIARNHLEERDTRWISANWDAWLTGEAEEEALPKELRDFAITADQGFDAISDLLKAGLRGQIIVSKSAPEGRIERGRLPRSISHVGVATEDDEAFRELDLPFVPPSSEAEEAVTKMWKQLLGLQRVGVHDNFFELGGTSLIALRLISRIKRDMGIDIPIVSIFEKPTVATFAVFMADHMNNGTGPNSPRENEENGEDEKLVPVS